MGSKTWQPDPTVVKQLYEELVKAYGTGVPQGQDRHLHEYAKTAAFLQDETACMAQLKRLNELLKIEAEAQGLDLDAEVAPNANMKHKKVLRRVLERELEKIGFQPDFGKATGYLKPSIFRSVIQDGRLLKDPGAGLTHGEFTHAIQWLLIGWQQQDSSFLQIPVIELFKRLGDEDSVYSRGQKERNLWDLLVDKDEDFNPAHKLNFRSPDDLHTFIVKNDELSALQKLCYEREKKRRLKLFSRSASPDKHKEYEKYPEKDVPLLLPVRKDTKK